jgi:hypothetical protein
MSNSSFVPEGADHPIFDSLAHPLAMFLVQVQNTTIFTGFHPGFSLRRCYRLHLSGPLVDNWHAALQCHVLIPSTCIREYWDHDVLNIVRSATAMLP